MEYFSRVLSRGDKLGSDTELLNIKVPVIISALLVITGMHTARDFEILAIVKDYTFEGIRQNENE